jgi:hypothetical protein
MSLAMYAASVEDNNDNDGFIQKKKQTIHNKTQKRNTTNSFDVGKVNSILDEIHNNQSSDSDNLGDFSPPPPPQSAGVNRTQDDPSVFRVAGKAPDPMYKGDNLDLNNFSANYGNSKTAEEYYKRVVPGYTQPINKQYYQTDANPNVSQDILLQKLNYMINLIEEQQDERTNNVTEEVILYSFLGIFIIFVVDSFAKVGKYVR